VVIVEELENAGWRLHTYACADNAALVLGTLTIISCLKRIY